MTLRHSYFPKGQNSNYEQRETTAAKGNNTAQTVTLATGILF